MSGILAVALLVAVIILTIVYEGDEDEF